MSYYCGIDFGTSNSVVTLIGDQGPQDENPGPQDKDDPSHHPPLVIREPSLMYFPEHDEGTAERYCGSRALAEYIDHGMTGRFFQSVKTILPDPGFTHTTINGKRFSASDLVAVMLRYLREEAERRSGRSVTRAVLGRPARFSQDPEREQIAGNRLQEAATQAGFTHVEFELEPVAGAHAFAETSTTGIPTGSVIFVADHGGGTSDFTLFRLGRDTRNLLTAEEVLSTHGIRAGGDDFDGTIMWNRLVETFGYGTHYESFGKYLPVPVHIYHIISRWDQIHFLKTLSYREELKYYLRSSDNPLTIRRLIKLVEEDLGYFIFKAIESAKIELSSTTTTVVAYEKDKLRIHEELGRDEFEGYISRYTDAIQVAIDDTLTAGGLGLETAADAVQGVFMTGGSSRVPAVRRLMERRFGSDKIIDDQDQFQSVSLGLALVARERGIASS